MKSEIVAPEYQAAIGGWKSVNGYSGYGPNYYPALQDGVRAELDELFEPFRAQQDLHVVVSADATRLRALVERQPAPRDRTRPVTSAVRAATASGAFAGGWGDLPDPGR